MGTMDVKELVRSMTLEEKAGLCSGSDFWHTKPVERLGIESVMLSDGPHGLRKQTGAGDHLGLGESVEAVAFPAGCAMASSFDRGLTENVGKTLGEECQAENLSVLLGPAINIKRNPLCGRNFEYFSEDPFLTGEMAVAYINGVQSWDVGTSVKHFALNSQEYNRMSVSAEIDERTMREIYLPGFEKAVKKARPKTIMCAYNKVNGTYCSENKKLLTDILRKEWGYEGYVVTDWGAVANRVKGIQAGLDLEMPGSNGENDARIVEAVRNGELDETLVDQAAENILNVIFSYTEHRHPEAEFDREADHAKSVEAAKECAVLMKNENVLPVSPDKKVVYIGGFAKDPRYQGGGSSHIHSSKVTSAYDTAMEKQRNVTYVEGFPADKDELDEAALKDAVQAAKEADVAVVFAGLPDIFESEGYDRTHMQMPECQNKLIEEVAKVQKNTVVVLHNGSVIELPWADHVAGILEMYLGGQGVGAASDALLFGEANPSGHLAETWPLRLQDNPSYLYCPGDGVTSVYGEGIYVGYRYYDKKEIPVRFAFGHGLSYTTFAYSNLRTSVESFGDKDTVEVCVDVTNTGDVKGKAVAQLYISDRTGTANRPVKELKGFEKVELEPGETKTVSMQIDARSLSYYHVGLGGWYAKSGTYMLMVGSASNQIEVQKEIQFTTEKLLPFTVVPSTTIGELLTDPRTAPAIEKFVSSMGRHEAKENAEKDGYLSESDEKANEAMTFGMPLKSLVSFRVLSLEQLEGLMAMLNETIASCVRKDAMFK